MGLNKGVHNDHRRNAAPRPVDLSMGQIWRARRAEVADPQVAIRVLDLRPSSHDDVLPDAGQL